MTGIIILAAGGSSRLGHPKQKLLYKGQTLLNNAVSAALQTGCGPVIVVLGAYQAKIKRAAQVTTIYNKNWEDGMGSSIKTGVLEIINDSSIDQVIIMLCDQPFVNSGLLNALINKQNESSKAIVASGYHGIAGVPALFKRTHFHTLTSLQGEGGAKNILNDQLSDALVVPFEAGAIDIDTPADYANLIASGN